MVFVDLSYTLILKLNKDNWLAFVQKPLLHKTDVMGSASRLLFGVVFKPRINKNVRLFQRIYQTVSIPFDVLIRIPLKN